MSAKQQALRNETTWSNWLVYRIVSYICPEIIPDVVNAVVIHYVDFMAAREEFLDSNGKLTISGFKDTVDLIIALIV